MDSAKIQELMKKMEEESKSKMTKPSVLDSLPKLKRSLSDNFDNDAEKMEKTTKDNIQKFEQMFGIGVQKDTEAAQGEAEAQGDQK